jgi:hypothetical protein
MTSTLHSIATEYAARTSRTGIRGNVMWESDRDWLTHAFMLAVADILELAEGTLALAASGRQVEILERQLDDARRGEETV